MLVGCPGGQRRAPRRGWGGRLAVDTRRPRVRRGGERPPAARDGDGGGRRGRGSGGTPPRRKKGGVAPATATAGDVRDVKGGGDAGHRRWCAAACTENAPSVGGGAPRAAASVSGGARTVAGPALHRRRATRAWKSEVGGTTTKTRERLRKDGRGGTVGPPPAGVKAGQVPRDAKGAQGGRAPTRRRTRYARGGAAPAVAASCIVVRHCGCGGRSTERRNGGRNG